MRSFWLGIAVGSVLTVAGIAVAGFAHALKTADELKKRATAVTGDAAAAEPEPAVGGDDAVVG